MGKNFSRTDIDKALDQLSQWFPEEAKNIATHKDQLIDHIVNDTSPEPTSPLALVEFATVPVEEAAALTLDACTEACLWSVVDIVIFVFGICGIRVKNEERVARAMMRELGEDFFRGFARQLFIFSNAEGAAAKAKALFPIVIGIYRAGAFRAALAAIKDEMGWFDWVKAGAIVTAQFVVWIASDGIAFAAEVALLILGAVQLIQDATKVTKACILPA